MLASFACRTAVALAFLALVSCHSSPTAAGPDDAAGVEAEVLAAVRAFEQAERDLDGDRVLSFVDPAFYMYQDGRRGDYRDTVSQIAATMPTLKRFETSFTDVEVTPLAADAALVSLLFHDVITDGSGETIEKWGPTTMIWKRRAAGWRLVYVDADHYDPR